PKSRALLSAVSPHDFSNENHPFGTAQEIEIGMGLARAHRVSYVGELGWELYVSADQATHVFEAIEAAGADHGLTGDVTFTTQLSGGAKKSSSVFDPDPGAGAQTHTAAFKKTDVGTGFWEAYVQWTSNNGDRETLLGLQFRDTSVIGAYSSGESFQQNKTADVPVWEP
ncbi:MAG: hypothetical protein AAFV53_23310, partial [Myxococcota bacterium]